MDKATQVLPKGFRLQSRERVYEIVKVLGSGSFGITYLATSQVSIGNIMTTIRFAIKEHFISASCYRGDDGATVLSVPTARSEVSESRTDFLTEANRLKKLCNKSRNIVSVNEAFEANGTAYYVMEYLDGGCPSRCAEGDAVSIVMQVAEALNEIHGEHVLHLDLKPDNIVMKTNERGETFPVVIDFGISKHFDSKGRPTSSLNAKGASPGYAPQEQYAGVSEFSPQYDIYALGAVLFYLCTGKNPPNAFKISLNQQELRKELAGKVSANVEKAILNSMKPNAAERTPSIRQFCDDLMGIDFVPFLLVSTTRLDFSKSKGVLAVDVDSNIFWSVYADESWCRVTKNAAGVTVAVAKNKDAGSRECDVVFTGVPYKIMRRVRVCQQGGGTVSLREKNSVGKKDRRKVLGMAGAVVVGVGLIAGCSVWLRPNPAKESLRLTAAIESNDAKTLKEFADRDSLRAYIPYARYLVGLEKYDDAEKYAARMRHTADSVDAMAVFADIESKRVVIVEAIPVAETNEIPDSAVEVEDAGQSDVVGTEESESNDEKFARAGGDFNLMLSLAKDNYAKAYYPVAEMYFNRKDSRNARIWADKAVNAGVNRAAAKQLLTKIKQTSQPTDDDLFAKATTLDDYSKLAARGYKKAYAPLAEKYLRAHDYDNAHQWAVKAGRSGVGTDRARKVVNVLASYGYYENNDKPSF